MTRKHNRWGWVFVSPYIFALLAFTLIPLIASIYFSLCRYDMFDPPKFIGLKNYKYIIFEYERTWVGFRNTWLFGLFHLTLDTSVACVLAVMLNQKIKGIGFFRVVYFMPVLTPLTAVALVWSLMYQPTNGILNTLFGYIGLGPFQYTYSKNYLEIILSIVATTVWKGVGSTTIYLIAGLQSISTDVMEAAEIDGANGLQKFFKITIPLLSPTLFFLLITGAAGCLQVFEQFFLMLQNTGAEAYVVNGLIYDFVWSAEGKIGQGAALGWVSFVFIAILTIVQKVGEKRWVHYE